MLKPACQRGKCRTRARTPSLQRVGVATNILP